MRRFCGHGPRRLVAGTLAVVLLSSILAFPVAAQEAGSPGPSSAPSGSDCTAGVADGSRDGEGSLWWVLAGAGCGIIGVGAAYLVKPSPPMAKVMGKPADYVKCYTEAYKKKAGHENTQYAWGGCGLALLITAAATRE
jgi:hypothetical protein